MTIHVDYTEINLVNIGPHFPFWQLKNSQCQKCHALGKIKGALDRKIKYYYTNVTSKAILYQINAHIKLIEIHAEIYKTLNSSLL